MRQPRDTFAPLTTADPARIGPYTLLGRLGAGGMGTVYAARGRGRAVIAVKTVHPELAADREFRARFHREIGLVERVSTPFAPRFVAADARARLPWLATEYVPGLALDRWARERGPLAGGALLSLAAGVLEALRALHAQGVVHRDLKPANVILSPAGPRVLDFGIARAMDGTVLTRTGGLAGSSGWISPERYRDGVSTSGADVFAWGALVAYAATGRAPFGAGEPQVVARRVLREEPDLVGLQGPLLPLVQAALTKDPARRPGAADLLHRLTRGGEEAATLVDREWRGFGGSAAAPAPARRRAPFLVVAAVAAALVIGAGTALLLQDAGTADTETGTEQEASETGAGVPGTGLDGQAWPPEGARATATNVGHTTVARVSQVDRIWTEEDYPDVERAPYGVITVNPGPASRSVLFSGISRGSADELVIDLGAEVSGLSWITRGNLIVVTQEGVFPARSPDEEIDPSTDDESVFFPGAPDRGLIVYTDPDYEENVRGEPPVGLCYDAVRQLYSTVYEDCV
ncbi:serine/threonine-protein kinase [Nocardiopsis valliformis]|uniref:serine/threonine-protein kinase n=1 Tax=Nocardiopsis valliformis TaxID=239974 RepID=UPI00034A7242|nr:serine/threonine-protein kinase [Nocardiopsis valliformis]